MLGVHTTPTVEGSFGSASVVTVGSSGDSHSATPVAEGSFTVGVWVDAAPFYGGNHRRTTRGRRKSQGVEANTVGGGGRLDGGGDMRNVIWGIRM